MNERIANLRELIVDGKHKVYRRSPDALGIANLSDDFAQKGLSPMERSAEMLSTLLNKEDPVILPGERIVITRTITSIPDIFTETEYAALKNDFFLHEKGVVCNISPDYGTTIRLGLAARRQEIEKRMTDASLSEDQLSFLRAALKSVSALQSFIGKYAEYAEKIGETETARVLRTIRTEGAQSLREALQLLRALHFSLWEAGNYHNTLGRFDQYIYPYYQQDIEQGHLTQEEAFELVEEFFLMCNKDSDLYPGIQQGDNGQSLVLGGRDIKGNCLFNELSEMCLRASYELQLIDPKINIRVDKNTPEKIFEMGSQLTKIGLGFPQYSNDDVIIPGLIRKGYTPEDAHNYVVAACWEFIVPGNGMDIPNIDAISLVACVKEALPELEDTKTFEDFYRRVEEKIQQQANEKCTKHQNLYIFPAPMMSVLMDRCIADARDISLGNTYNNYGIHGTGIASAVDSLVAIKQAYFEEGRVSAQALLSAVDSNFATDKELQKELRELPKMGQDDDEVDLLASRLLDSFDKALMGKRNERGGVYRAGTGTACTIYGTLPTWGPHPTDGQPKK